MRVCPTGAEPCRNPITGFTWFCARADNGRSIAPAAAQTKARRLTSGGLVEEFATDQHAADFAGAGADLVELGVAQQATGRVIVDIAVAAEDLHRVEGDLGRGLGG